MEKKFFENNLVRNPSDMNMSLNNSNLLHKVRFVRVFKNHILVNWKGTGKMRFYRFFEEIELRELIQQSGLDIIKIEWENESMNVYVKKNG